MGTLWLTGGEIILNKKPVFSNQSFGSLHLFIYTMYKELQSKGRSAPE